MLHMFVVRIVGIAILGLFRVLVLRIVKIKSWGMLHMLVV